MRDIDNDLIRASEEGHLEIVNLLKQRMKGSK